MRVVYATMSGNSEFLARAVGQALAVEPTHADEVRVADLVGHAIFVVPSWGDGEVPADAEPLIAALEGATLDLAFALIAPGDSSYADFCGGGKRFAEALTAAGGRLVGELLCLDGTPAERHLPAVTAWLDGLAWDQTK